MFRLIQKKVGLILNIRGNNKKELYSKKFTQKHSAYRHIQALLIAVKGKSVLVQDEGLRVTMIYKVTPKAVIATKLQPKKLK